MASPSTASATLNVVVAGITSVKPTMAAVAAATSVT